ncbi:MAG: thioredoxin [Deltaproteobacteria bacterium]|nr:MAG: thioredoxin [Deltaproteobacteria bacterium]
MDELEDIRKRKLEEMKRKLGHRETNIEVNDGNFGEKVIEQSKEVPVVVDFWAEWCVPCRMLGPALEHLADKYGGKFVLAKLNVDQNPLTSSKYGIMSIPSVKMFKNGGIADEFVGMLPEPSVDEWIKRNIR